MNVASPPPDDGSGDDGGYPDPTPEACPVDAPPTDSLVRNFCDSVNASQQKEILDALSQFKANNCVQAGIYSNFANNGTKFTFCVSSTMLTKNANIDLATYTITINVNTITTTAVGEELFHAYQNSVYPNGTAQYNPTGRVDIEFEQAFWQDIIQTSVNAGAMNGASQSDLDAYKIWIGSITNGDTIYPRSLSAADQTQYNHFLYLYYQLHPTMGTPIYLTPQAVFSSFIYFGCK